MPAPIDGLNVTAIIPPPRRLTATGIAFESIPSVPRNLREPIRTRYPIPPPTATRAQPLTLPVDRAPGLRRRRRLPPAGYIGAYCPGPVRRSCIDFPAGLINSTISGLRRRRRGLTPNSDIVSPSPIPRSRGIRL